ncbi:MAG: Uma2 family endonuclease [Oscillatoria sp. SIO1A7]|nr:Uma2 family endonuclease [Oscillatoria sp. SIO1A7]
MTTAKPPNLGEILQLTDEQFYELCQNNRDLRIERTAGGDLIVMAPTGGETGHRNIDLAFQLQAWSRQNEDLGVAFDSSTGFKLPNGADVSPDASWVSRDRLSKLTAQQKQRFLPLCPDFVVELRSPTDSLRRLQAKMADYIENGARLGLLINPQKKQVEIYRPGRDAETLQNPATVSGENVMPGFVLELGSIFRSL